MLQHFGKKCKCGAIEYFPLQDDPIFLPPPVPPEEGHKHEYEPFDPLMELMERLNQIIQRLERIEQRMCTSDIESTY